MLSLPLITPRPDANLWPSHRTSHHFDTDSSTNATNQSNRHPNSHHGAHSHHATTRISILSTLATDENIIEHRKHNVRMFGAGWIRPPGVAKTYQAIEDEKAEQQEQEALARREQVMMDLAAAQQEAANEEARQRGDEMEGMEEERDLDDEVPEAEEAEESLVSGSDDESASDGSEGEAGDGDTSRREGDMTFNEDSFLEGSMVAAEVEHMLEMEEAEMAGVLQDERDLDDDIPEAGSYEHTDSELEDSTSEEEASLGPGMSSTRRRSGRRSSGRLSSGRRSSGLRNTAGRSSFDMDGSSSILEGSSFMRSSPVAPRGNLRDRFLGVARGGTGQGS